MVQPLSGLRRLLGSVRIWPDERYGVGGNDSITTVKTADFENKAEFLQAAFAKNNSADSLLSCPFYNELGL